MDAEDGYSNLSEYEDDIDRIFDLNHEADKDEDDEDEASESEDESSSEGEGDDSASEEEETKASVSRSNVSRNPSPPPSTKSPPALDVNDVLDELDDDDSISDDERDLIYSRIYHSNTTQHTGIPPKTAQHPSDSRQKTKSNRLQGTDQPPTDLASTKFTFEIDLDNVPPPPLPPSPPPQVLTLDSDSDDELSYRKRSRYFAPQNYIEPTQPMCYRCNQRGHVLKDCPHTLCRTCGAIDATHHQMQCPFRHTCQNCGQRGHLAWQCQIKSTDDRSKPCTMCGGWGHVAAMCHQIWRFYRAVDPTKVGKLEDVAKWCYNCAGRGHLGDDCTRPRPLYVQGGRIGPVISAFGEANLPEWAKQAAPAQSKKRRNSEEEDEDDWFRERERHGDNKRSGPPKKKIGKIDLPTSKNRPPSRDRSPVRPPSSSLEDRINRPLSNDRGPTRDRSPVRPPFSSIADRISGQRRGDQGTNSVDSYRPSYAPMEKDSYVPRYRDRDRDREHGASGSRDWDEKITHWRRNRDSDSRR